MKQGLEINPSEVSTCIFLGRQDISNEVVPVKEPLVPENIQDIKDGGTIIHNLRGSGSRSLSRRGKGCHFRS